MRLIKSKVRCVKGVTDTGWFVPGRGTTVVVDPRGGHESPLLKAMESLHPIYNISQVDPLANHPKIWQQGTYTKRVDPQKKTAVVMVFAAEPELVKELADVDSALIETDRIEIGRRLDYSRWMTFVEISASTRWSEISETMARLGKAIGNIQDLKVRTQLAEQWERLQNLKQTDRVKHDVGKLCSVFLKELTTYLPEDLLSEVTQCQAKVGRAGRFNLARTHVYSWLPPFLRITASDKLMNNYDFGVDPHRTDGSGIMNYLVNRLGQMVNQQGKSFTSSVIEDCRDHSHPLLPQGIPLPGLTVTDNAVVISDLVEQESGRLVQHLALVCLLSKVVFGRASLLLMDHIFDAFAAGELRQIVPWVQEMSSQAIVATAQEEVGNLPGWHTIKSAGPGGLEKDQLHSD